MSEVERLVEAFRQASIQLGEQIGAGMKAWREANGIPEWTDPGYLGNRCGWYPEKPKRRRKSGARATTKSGAKK